MSSEEEIIRMANDSRSNSGMGIIGILTIIFVVLKLTDNTDWSWWWALSPIWIPLAFTVFIILSYFFFAFIRSFFQ